MAGGLIAMDLWSWAATCPASAEMRTVTYIASGRIWGFVCAWADGEADSELFSSYLHIVQTRLAAPEFEI